VLLVRCSTQLEEFLRNLTQLGGLKVAIASEPAIEGNIPMEYFSD
jgi:hypothetical protein